MVRSSTGSNGSPRPTTRHRGNKEKALQESDDEPARRRCWPPALAAGFTRDANPPPDLGILPTSAEVYRTREVETDEIISSSPTCRHITLAATWDTFFTTTPGVVLRIPVSQIRDRGRGQPIRVILPEQVPQRGDQHAADSVLSGGKACRRRRRDDGRPEGTITARRRMFGPAAAAFGRVTSVHGAVDRSDTDWPKDDPNRDRNEGTGWLEIWVRGWYPNVLKAGGYNLANVTGFAFGMGPQRMLMLKHAIDDIRLFWQNDLRFLGQF